MPYQDLSLLYPPSLVVMPFSHLSYLGNAFVCSDWRTYPLRHQCCCAKRLISVLVALVPTFEFDSVSSLVLLTEIRPSDAFYFLCI